MSMIQIRNVPEDVHRTLKARAAEAGMSLSDYLLDQITGLAQRPTPKEIFDRIARRERVDVDTVSALRAEREGRG